MSLYDESIEFDEFGEENEEDLTIENLNVFNNVVMWGTDWTTETIVNQLDKGNIDLNPKFQRRDAWNRIQKSRLIESLLLGLPVPPIILAERKGKRNSFIVIDGKQRLLAIRQFCASSTGDFEQLKLSGLQYLKVLNGKSFNDIQDDAEFVNYRESFENQAIRAVVIKNWPNEEFLFAVFLRLNTGSKKLSPQELRQALHPGEFLDYIDETSSRSEAIMKMLRIEKPDSRMRDVELAIRYFAFKYYINEFRGNLKELLDLTCKRLNDEWNARSYEIASDFKNLELAIEATFSIFGEKEAFSKWTDAGKFSGRFNRAVFEIMVYYFSDDNIRNAVLSNKDAIVNSFKELCTSDPDFNSAIEFTTKDIHKTVYRFSKWRDVIALITGIDIPEIKLIDGKIENN